MTCKAGDRIRLINMAADPDPVPVNSEGTVISYSPAVDQIMVKWDNGRTLNLIESLDTYIIIDPEIELLKKEIHPNDV